MMHIQSEANNPLPTIAHTPTGSFKDRLTEAKTRVVTAVLAGHNCYVQGSDAPLRYRLLNDTALRLTELDRAAAYFDLTDMAYQYDLATWVKSSIRLLSIHLTLPTPQTGWLVQQSENDPIAFFLRFLRENVLLQQNKPVTLSFDEVDQLNRAPLAADFWRLLSKIEAAQRQIPAFAQLTVVLWGQAPQHELGENGRFPTHFLKPIIL